MSGFLKYLCGAIFLFLSWFALADEQAEKEVEKSIEQLQAPLYNPFVERYMLDEVKQLRIELAEQKNALTLRLSEKEVGAADRALRYANDTVTYFFYLIAGVSSVLVLVGWSSIREIKERVHSIADKEIAKLIDLYEKRLNNIEQQLKQKSKHIDENREEIELTRTLQSLWLRASQETEVHNKIPLYDQILSLYPTDADALSHKADAVLELDEPQWAVNLCQQALAADPNHAHALYQLACAYTRMQLFDDAVQCLQRAVAMNEGYRTQMMDDAGLTRLHQTTLFKKHFSAQ